MTVRFSRHAAFGAAAALCLALLSGCGGGGGGSPRATPAQASLGYTVAVTSDWSTGSYGQRLNVLDPDNASVLRSIAIGDSNWVITRAVTPGDGGLSHTQLAEAALYYLKDGRLQAINLQRGASTAPRQVSSLAQGCTIAWNVDSNASGQDSWLAVVMAGPDGDCDTALDNTAALVQSGATASSAPIPAPFSPGALLTTSRSASGALERLVTFSLFEGKLVQWLLEPSGPRAIDVVNGGGITWGTPVRWLSPAPGSISQGLVQVGNTVRTLSWSGAVMTLSGPVLSTSTPADQTLSALDGQFLYVVANGDQIWKINAAGAASLLATLDTDDGDVTELRSTASALWVVQADAPRTTLTSVVKASGQTRQVATYTVPAGLPDDIGITLAAVSGERLVYGVPSDVDDDDNASIYVVASATAAPTLLVARSVGGGVRTGPVVKLGQEQDATHLMWCELIGTAPDCTTAGFKSYELATGRLVSLSADASQVWESPEIADLAGQQRFITATRWASNEADTPIGLWQFKPDTAGSLTRIVVPTTP